MRESGEEGGRLFVATEPFPAGSLALLLRQGRLEPQRARLPQGFAERLPAITWFSVSGHINGGIRGVVRAEARDEEAANNLRDVVRGFMALGKLQAGSNPQVQLMLQSLELGGQNKTVALSFMVPVEVFDAISTIAPKRRPAEKPELEKDPAR